MTTTSANGRARKSLAEQIDRLDVILDRLAENLNETVTAAVKEAMAAAVPEAVQAAAFEVLTNAERQKQLGTARVPDNEPAAPAPVRLADGARRCWGWLVGLSLDAWDTVTAVGRMVKVGLMEAANHFVAAGRAKAEQVREQLTARVRAGWMRLLMLALLVRQRRRRLLVSLGAGVVVGLVAYLAGPLVVPVVCGLAGFVASMIADAWRPLRRRTTTPEAGGG